jgi:hypothetical protein
MLFPKEEKKKPFLQILGIMTGHLSNLTIPYPVIYTDEGRSHQNPRN